ncbi:hypothetical protein PVAND_002049 [Polypedilum vanderplanki]|uniref:Serine hydrolase domain-containing protein n=1 Tax=Polypedilum vanderplanki TaxID=319348 RepID=A0A9J6BQ54_POLVA|nr:hypothetical protein PVAND_002049 [Polypedilum vanderplanki]
MGKNKLKIPDSDKLNVLCLHGYRQNAETFRNKTGSFRKFVGNYVNCTYINAQNLANTEDNKDGEQKSWWANKDDGSFKGTNQNGPAIGFEDSLKQIEKIWREQNFHGLVGFSQGASFVSLLCSMSERNLTLIKPRFAVMVAGFKSASLVHKNYYENKISIPSLHVYGMNDDIIDKEMSKALADCFVNPIVVTHPGGHFFPATAANEKEHYINFFKDQLQSYLEDRELKLNGVITQDQEDEEELASS